MPRVARFTLSSLSELSRQLRYAPPETRAKQMDAAEAFAAELETDQLYPEDFVIYRITGYKPQMNNPTLLVGEALTGDLATFVQLVSDGLKLPPDYRGRHALGMHDVASRLHVSSKTLLRYRKRGLFCHYITFAPDEQRLACFEDALDRFVNNHQAQVQRAGSFTRIDTPSTRIIVEQARSLRTERGMSLNEAALELSRQHNRAHETIRMMLRRHDRRSTNPIFSDRGPLTERDARVLYRAWRWGIPISQMAERYGRTPTTIHRVINRRRGTLLQAIDLRYVELPTFERNDAGDVILAVRHVREGFDRLFPSRDALALLEAAKRIKRQSEAEVALLAAYNFLKRRALSGIRTFGEWPGASELDGVETDLRWSSRIKRHLVFLGLPIALSRIEQHLHRPLHEHPSDHITASIHTAVEVVSNAIETINPAKGQLSRVVAYASDRTLARHELLARVSGRATVRHATGSVVLDDPFVHLTPWEAFLEPRGELAGLVEQLHDGHTRQLLVLRYGFADTRPHSIAELAHQHGTTTTAMSHLLMRAESQLLGVLRHAKENPTG